MPAYAVVIKGTQVYDSGKGAFVDLSILDVLQIFGRAGRPQYEDQGVGYICTTYDKIDHYGDLRLLLYARSRGNTDAALVRSLCHHTAASDRIKASGRPLWPAQE